MPAKTSASRNTKTRTPRRRVAAKPRTAHVHASTAQDNSAESGNCYRFDAVLAINTVGALHADLAHLLAGETSVVLDASAIETIDTAAIQLLLAFVRELHAQHRTVNWQTPSQTISSTIALLGLTQTLGIA